MPSRPAEPETMLTVAETILSDAADRIHDLALGLLPPRLVVGALACVRPSWLAAMQRARFRRTLRLVAARSAFYREQFRRRRICVERIEHPSQLGDFYTTGEDLRAYGAEAFLVGHPDTAFETTGTTSPVPKRLFFSRREMERAGKLAALALRLLGLKETDRVASAFDCSFWVSPAVLRAALDNIGCFHLEAGKIDAREFHARVRVYRPTVIFGEPSWLARLSERAATDGTWPVKFLFAGGENIVEQTRRWIESVWQAPLYLNYGQTEAFGALGIECPAQVGYHRNDFDFLFEIADADADGYGELVYSTLARSVMPLIRYRAGDLTRLVEGPCTCGWPARRIAKVRARTDEMVVCGMGNVGPWVFAELLGGSAVDEWQATVRHDGARDVIELRVETDRPVPELEERARARLRERFSDFWKNYEMGLYELRVCAVPRGTLRGAQRKLRRIVDARPTAVGREKGGVEQWPIAACVATSPDE